ncbi:hypothetical protein E2C01_074520 [Portunus trituberculatus]|uniref:Uncharacterized protein n=1 Tax=Portunus trituberculatus TaxID=210409 RepID=A0A5B7I5V2_PORTR|nr:hypothetical protein [Portunus trituberculatus]
MMARSYITHTWRSSHAHLHVHLLPPPPAIKTFFPHTLLNIWQFSTDSRKDLSKSSFYGHITIRTFQGGGGVVDKVVSVGSGTRSPIVTYVALSNAAASTFTFHHLSCLKPALTMV